MKIAIVHELLTMKGGAERVLRIIAEMFPQAPIYTLLYDESKLGDWFPKDRIRISNQQPATRNVLPRSWKFNHHRYVLRFPSAVEAWDFADYDLVISTSSAFVHGIITNGKPKHLCYVHSPARYLWDRTHDVLDRSGRGILGPLKKFWLRRVFHTLRLWDAEVAPRPDRLLAASKEVQRRIELYWRRDSVVVYPPIDDLWFTQLETRNPPFDSAPFDSAQGKQGKQLDPPLRSSMEHPDYFLVVSTLAPYKNIDLAIEACVHARQHLKIVGEGPDRRRLERLARKMEGKETLVHFYGYRSGDELRDLYTGARATIVPGSEDFNLVAVESMACGTPVIALHAGGPRETIIAGVTGEFFKDPTPKSLEAVLLMFDEKRYKPETCRVHAERFSREKFQCNLQSVIDELMQE